MKVKDIILYVLILVLGIIVLFQSQCNGPEVELKDNAKLFDKIDVLEVENDSLKEYSTKIEATFKDSVNIKDSLVVSYKSKYIPVYDTISKTTVDALPKPYVDSLTMTYESLLGQAETIIEAKDEIISNLEEQNETKDTIITNYQSNEDTLNKVLRRERGKKWKWGGIGTTFGYVLGKIF